MKDKLTDKQCAAAKVSSGERLLADGDNLYLRVRPGNKAWMFIYVEPGSRKRRKLVLGAYPTHSLADARKWRDSQTRLVDGGSSPVVVKREALAELSSTHEATVAGLISAYSKRLLQRGAAESAARVLSTTNLYLSPAVLKTPVKLATHKTFTPAIARLIEDGKLRAAGKLRAYLSAAFALACNAEGDPSLNAFSKFAIEANPILRIRKHEGAGGKPGNRALTVPELLAYRAWLDKMPDSPEKRFLLVHLYSAGQRLRQLAAAKVVDDGLVLTDSKGRGSKAREHFVPFTPLLRTLVASEATLSPNPNSKTWAERLARVVSPVSAVLGIEHFTLRDIRRTAETQLAAAGFNLEVRAHLLSHGVSGVQTRHYVRHSFVKEKTTALLSWERLLTGKPGQKVVGIRG